MLPVLSVLLFVCLAAAIPHYNYEPPQGGSVAIHGIPAPVVAAPLAPFLAISHDAQKAVRPSVPLQTGKLPIAIRDVQVPIRPSVPLQSGSLPIAIRDVQVPIKPVVDTKPLPVISIPFSSVFVPRPPNSAIRDVQVPWFPMAEEEIEEDDESDEVEDVPLPVAQGTLPPHIAIQHDAQTPIKTDDGFLQNIFGFHTDIAYGPPLVNLGQVRPALTISDDIPVQGNAQPAPPHIAIQHDAQTPIKTDGGFLQNIFGFHTDIAYGPPLTIGQFRPSITNDIPVQGNAQAAPSHLAIRNQQVPNGGAHVSVTEDQEDLEDVELVGVNDKTSTSQESVLPRYVEVAYFPVKIANIFNTRELNADNEVLAPGGIVQSTQPIFFWTPFINSKAHEDIRSFTNSKAHPDTHKGPNENSVATLFRSFVL